MRAGAGTDKQPELAGETAHLADRRAAVHRDYLIDDVPVPCEDAWDKSIQQFQKDLKEMQDLVADTSHDLLAKIPHGSGQTLLREALVVADHNAYHLGQLVFLRKMLEGRS